MKKKNMPLEVVDTFFLSEYVHKVVANHSKYHQAV